MTKPTDMKTRDEVLPAWVTEGTGAGLEQTGDIQGASPFLYCVQSQTKDEDLKEEHGLGGVVIQPAGVGVAALAEPFDAIPLYLWLSWRTEKDYKDKSDTFWIMDSSNSMESEVAKKARNHDTWFEEYKDGNGKIWNARNVECINFIVQIDSGSAIGSVVQLTFCKGSYKFGRKLSQYLGRPKGGGVVDIYQNRLKLLCDKRKTTDDETYYCLEAHPAENPWIGEDQVEMFRAIYEGFKSAHAAGSLALGDEQSPSKTEDEAATS